jgi:hypothetical protein
MTLIMLGVLLVFGGMLQMAYQPIWRGRLSGGRRLRPRRPSETLEKTGWRLWDQIELAWTCDVCAWRCVLAGRCCRLSSKLTSFTLSGVARYGWQADVGRRPL